MDDENWREKIQERIDIAEKLFEKSTTFADENLTGSMKLSNRIKSELRFLKKIKSGKIEFKDDHLSSSNLTSLEALVTCIEDTKCISAILCPFHVGIQNGDDEEIFDQERKVIVDIVCNDGSTWMKVVARNAKALLTAWEGRGGFGEKSIITQAELLLATANTNLNNFHPPEIHFVFYKGVPLTVKHFLPETVTFLSQGDGNKHSKKPMETRHKELTAIISPGLVSYLKDNISTLARDKSLFMLVEAAINHCSTDISELISALIELLSVPFEAGVTDSNEKLHLVEDPAGHLLVKRLISHKPDDNTPVSFAKSLLETVASENISSWCSCNRGSQVLLSLIQCPIEDIASKSAKMLKKNLKLLKKNKKVKSTELLIEKLSK